MKGRLLFVDDEDMKRTALRIEAGNRGYEADEARNATEGLRKVRGSYYDVVVTDLRMPRMDGLMFLQKIRETSPDTTVMIMTAYGTVQNAVEAMKAGAYDYLLKPFSAEELFIKIERAMAYQETLALNRAFLGQTEGDFTFHRMVGVSRKMQAVYRLIARVAKAEATVLVTGESGTGKELVAEALHHFSDRAGGPLVKVSCATFGRDVLESELFGHVKGAFTGAVRDHRGRFEVAYGGTIFLDDVDDVPMDVQVKLLRVLQNRELERVGGEKTIPVNVRVIASTKVDLAALVSQERFREDLFYRLNVIQVEMPPLRERRDDIPLLASHFISKFSSAACKIRGIDERAIAALTAYDWPGNVRELENAIQRAVAFVRTDLISPADLPDRFDRVKTVIEPVVLNLEGRAAVDLPRTLQKVEEGLLRWALERSGGNQGRAAQLLGVPRTTLRDRMVRLGLDSDEDERDEPPSKPDGFPSDGEPA